MRLLPPEAMAERDAKIVALVHSGLSHVIVAQRFDVSKSTVGRLVREAAGKRKSRSKAAIAEAVSNANP